MEAEGGIEAEVEAEGGIEAIHGYVLPHSQQKKVNSDIIILSDDDSPTNGHRGITPINAHQKTNTGSQDGVDHLRELLEQEEQKLTVLKHIRGMQQTPLPALSPKPQPSVSRGSKIEPALHSSLGKQNIVVVPGNQKVSPSAPPNRMISSRLRQLVDSIAADQALNSCSQHLNTNKKSLKPSPQSSLHTSPKIASRSPVTKPTQVQHLFAQSRPPVPSLTSSVPSQASRHTLTLLSQTLMQLAGNNPPPTLRPKPVASRLSSHEVITISDSPSPVKNPPPLLPTLPISSVAKTQAAMINGSVQVPTISSTTASKAKLMAEAKVSEFEMEREQAIMKAVENSRRYKDYLMKQTHVRRSFQKQIEKKITMAPYPKTFRQVWPVIPIHDSAFVRNFGLESVFLHFDPNWKAAQEKANQSSRVKPICNQCDCDFASAWQIRKSNSKQLLLCEACDFTNLKILQRSKLSNQLKELMESIKKEEEKFNAECEEARKQVVALERQAILGYQTQRPPPLTSQLHDHSVAKVTNSGLTALNASVLTNHVIQATTKIKHQSEGGGVTYNSSNQGIVPMNKREQPRAVIPSILPTSNSSYTDGGPSSRVGGGIEGSRKRKDHPGRPSSPPSKVLKVGSVLDQTLNKLSQQLLKRKLDEDREVRRHTQQQQQAEKTKKVKTERPPSPSGVRRSRRKGVPHHKRHLSSSSVTSE